MKTSEEIKKVVRNRYSQIALQSKEYNQSCCCGDGGCTTETENIMGDDYTLLKGYNPDADLGLGCGLPTQFAKIKEGDTVVDLGSGAGNDCFVALAEAGVTGKVIGVDFSEAMIEKANENKAKLGLENIEFRFGEIENIPIESETADVVISNCVLNLVPDKSKAFAEIYRILKSGGHFSVSDIVLEGNLPEKIRNAAAMYAGCISGAVQKEEYLSVIRQNGFENITVQKSKPINLPDDILERYLSEEEIAEFKKSGTGVLSITVYAEK